MRAAPGKAEILRGLLDRHALAPDQALFVGDAMADWHVAAACGVDFLGRVSDSHGDQFPNGTRTAPDLRALGNLVTGRGE